MGKGVAQARVWARVRVRAWFEGAWFEGLGEIMGVGVVEGVVEPRALMGVDKGLAVAVGVG